MAGQERAGIPSYNSFRDTAGSFLNPADSTHRNQQFVDVKQASWVYCAFRRLPVRTVSPRPQVAPVAFALRILGHGAPLPTEAPPRSLRRRKDPTLHIDAKRCIPTTYRGHNGLKAFYRAGS